VLVLALACGGCNQLLGLDPPSREVAIDAPAVVDATNGDDGATSDAPPSADASSIDSSMLPIDARMIDAPTDACVPFIDGNECTYDTCGNPPTPRDSYCNGGADQCDGMGNCVDCTNSGGCGECCTCSINQTCIPA